MLKKRDILISFSVSLLLAFMIFIFGPAEIFFANVSQFEFLFGEFIGYMVIIFAMSVLIITFICFIMPQKVRNILISVLFSSAVLGYLQVMFLNKNLDLLGVNPNGYQVQTSQWVINLFIWLAVFIGVIVLLILKKEIWKKFVSYMSFFLLGIQVVAMISLPLTAPRDAFERVQGNARLSGVDQYTVSAKDNVIVLVLDYFSSMYLQQMLEVYPDGADCLHDFTYYSNADCTYYGTYPSLPHMLTGCEMNANMLNQEWCKSIWEDESTLEFYKELKNQNYKANVYTTDANVLTAGNGTKILYDKISNVTYEPRKVEVDKGLLIKTLTKMSCYRMSPDIMKALFYTNVSEYSLIVKDVEAGILQTNSDFYTRLQEKGLASDDSANYFILHHLIGTHEFNTDVNGYYIESTTVEETARGCMTIVEAYLNELKRLGVYNNATIIITADHGGCDKWDLQVVYYVKKPGETHEISPVTNAPISHCDLLPTVAQAAGLDYTKYGQSIFDFEQDEQRERTIWIRNYEDYDGPVYLGYTYVGDILALVTQIDQGPTTVNKMREAYY